ncbi:methyltransferase domain-containing protein [Phaeosphaeria sp. MPI-PUGE-AT-0046c]|nr:methyltransferase domain-containing protein [Phaeosphaeria sp. MPI-PUGE-AT-0046c]
MLPTPSTSHVCFDRVYEPAEDSYLLLDTLSAPSETGYLRDRFPKGSSTPPVVLEVGVGSGVVLAFVAANALSILGRHDVLTLGVDINSFACKAAATTTQNSIAERDNGRSVFLDVVNGDLASAIRASSVDIFIFNPPYVPAELPDLARHDQHNTLPEGKDATTFEQDSYLLELSYAGGEDGMVVTNRMLEQIPGILSKRGVAYVLLCAQNKPEVVKERIRAWGDDWLAETVGSSGQKAGWEKLVIVRIWRNGV